ncbi:MAG: sulfatase [Planctomycetes bacterium]|nr:sulfatase [Planctomycetota bacterium]
MTRSAIFGIALALAAGAGGWFYYHHHGGTVRRAAPGGSPSGPVPLILVSIDTLRADAVSGFGARPGQTPNMLQVGDEGIRFDTAIAPTHFTSASHATMLTGYSPYVHGTAIVRSQTTAIPKSIPTIGEILQQNGYYSAGFTDSGQVIHTAGFNRGFDIFLAEPTGFVEKLPDIEGFLDHCDDKPFFLFLHTYRTHAPYRAEKTRIGQILNNYNGQFGQAARLAAHLEPRDALRSDSHFEELIGQMNGARAKSPVDQKLLHTLYNSAVTCADAELGEILKMLKNRGLYDNSLIVITSDHGEAFFEHGVDSHKNVYDECLRVPLVIRLPGARLAGTRVPETFPSVNLTPTILDLLKIKHNNTFEGRSAAAEIEKGHVADEFAFVNWYMGRPDRIPEGFAVRSRDAKIIEKTPRVESETATRPAPIVEYYEIVRDPLEASNLAGKGAEGERRLVDALQVSIERWKALRAKFLPNGPTIVEVTDEESRTLRGIGYFK